MAGVEKGVRECWELLQKHLTLDEPTPFELYLGCAQSSISVDSEEVVRRLKTIRPLYYGIEAANEDSRLTARPGKPVRAIQYDMKNFLKQCVERYLELTGKGPESLKTKKPVVYPGIDDHQLKEEWFDTVGELAPIASKIIMKILYGARMCRWDLLQACCTLAREVTRWNKNCDVRLHKLMCYIMS